MAEFWQFAARALTVLDVQSPLTMAGRLKLFADLVHGTVLDVGPATMMLKTLVPPLSPKLKLILLLGFPAVVLALSFALRRASPGLNVVLALLFGFLLLVLAFGSRLWLHHAAVLLPLSYAAFALALEWLSLNLLPAPRIVALLVALPLMFVNAVDAQATFQRLRATGGVGLTSSALTQLAEDAVRTTAASRFFFPDWGVFMSFAMITRGSIPYSTDFTPAYAKATLCLGQDAVVVVTGDAPTTRISEWTAAVAGEAPVLTGYTQRDGVLVLTSARWKAGPGRGTCS